MPKTMIKKYKVKLKMLMLTMKMERVRVKLFLILYQDITIAQIILTIIIKSFLLSTTKLLMLLTYVKKRNLVD